MKELIKNSNIFDEKWYRYTYPDLRNEAIDAAEHYLRYGGFEGRDPGPSFSTSGYLNAHPDVSMTRINPLIHYLKYGKKLGRSPLSIFEGDHPLNHARNHNILVCGHLCASHVFGAEKSLIDVVKAMSDEGFNVFLTLPCVGNSQYLADACKLVHKVIILPYFWWHEGRDVCREIQHNFESLILKYDVDLVYANTITLFEPLIAADKLGIPSVVHARELPAQDKSLCEILQSDYETIQKHVHRITTRIIANSNIVADFFDNIEGVSVIPNVINTQQFDMENEVDYNCFKIGLISSNIPKKGIYNFVELAKLFDGVLPNYRFLLIGPETSYIHSLKENHKTGVGDNSLPSNIDFYDYIANPADAISKVNILLNLSHFQESFGRTVLEAMAAKRPVICYDWGALSELVVHDVTGYLVPFRDIVSIKNQIIHLYNSPELFSSMAEAGRERACKEYGPEVFQARISGFLSQIILSTESI